VQLAIYERTPEAGEGGAIANWFRGSELSLSWLGWVRSVLGRNRLTSEIVLQRCGLAVKDWLDVDHRSPIDCLNSLHLDEPTSVYAKDPRAVKTYRIGPVGGTSREYYGKPGLPARYTLSVERSDSCSHVSIQMLWPA